jgi:hypothetical protein
MRGRGDGHHLDTLGGGTENVVGQVRRIDTGCIRVDDLRGGGGIAVGDRREVRVHCLRRITGVRHQRCGGQITADRKRDGTQCDPHAPLASSRRRHR